MNWKFWNREPQPKSVAQEDALLAMAVRAWDEKIMEAGFRHWFNEPPPYGEKIELARRTWPNIAVLNDRSEARPEMNCYGLWWRPYTGLGGFPYEADRISA